MRRRKQVGKRRVGFLPAQKNSAFVKEIQHTEKEAKKSRQQSTQSGKEAQEEERKKATLEAEKKEQQ